MYFQLYPSTLPIEEIGFGLLLGTPRAMERPRSEKFLQKEQGINRVPTPSELIQSEELMKRYMMLPTPKLLKTPCAADAHTENMSKKEQKFGNSGTLAQEVQTGFIYQRGMLPTPTAVQREHPERVAALKEAGAKTMMSRVNGEQRPNSILDALMFQGMLPTPSAFDYKSGVKQETYQNRKLRHAEKGVNLQYPLKQMAADMTKDNGKTSQLNPRFVAEMMGFPPNWTESPFQNGETNQSRDTGTQ
jgi:hypothetical protein